MLCALGLGVSTVNPVETPIAAAETNVFVMEEKASARLAESSSGIRFRVKMDAAAKAAVESAESSGMLIFPNAYLTDTVYAAQKFHDSTEGLKAYVDANTNGKLNVYEADGSYWANGVVANIKEANYNLEYTAIAYYETNDVYTYATVSQDFSRSVTNVMTSAYLENKQGERAKIDAYCTWFATEAAPIRIDDKTDFENFAKSVSTDNTYADKFVNIETSIDFGEGDGTDITAIPAAFEGTLTATDGVALTYKSTADFVPLAENYALLKGIYKCTFDMASDWTDKLVTVNNTNLGVSDLKSYTTDSDVAAITPTGTVSKVRGYKQAYWNYYFTVNFGFDLEDYAAQLTDYTHLQFKLAYTLVDGKEYYADNAITNGLVGGTIFDEANAGQWKTYEFTLAEVMANQATSGYGFAKLFYTRQSASQRYNIYVADVQFVEKELNLEPINVTEKFAIAGATSTTKGMATSTDDTNIANITGTLPASATVDGVISVYYYMLQTSNQKATQKLSQSISDYINTGYTHLMVYIATNANTHTFSATSTLIDFTGVTKGSENSNKWLSYEIKLDSLSDISVSSLTLFTLTGYTGADKQGVNRKIYVYTELVRK